MEQSRAFNFLPSGVYAILDLTLGAFDPVAAARAMCRAGVAAVQLRAKAVPDGALLGIARAVAAVCRKAGVPFIVNDRADIAVLAGADGVHVGQDDLPPGAVRRAGPDLLIGLSTHSASQVRAAARAPVHYIGLGPVFPTTTKALHDTPLGPAGFASIARRSTLPVVAIGGIGIEDVGRLRAAGAHAVALASALLSEGDPGPKAAAAVRSFNRNRSPFPAVP